ncbi:MAG TPA: RluA family pseudouridine synthase [Candidatus Deferrimicrobium sp.]|nr:RluA family pseudouridine synthase [Candidatus Deferrimicrobium sp.]
MNGNDENQIWLVPDDLQAVRLDGFVRQCLPHLSRQEVHRAIAEKFFLLNGRVARKGDSLNGGDRLCFVGPADLLSDAPPPARQLEIPIIYEDDSLLVVDKPAGVATHGFSGRDRATLANFLAAQRPGLLNIGKSRWEPGLVHRLDIETSGVVLVAKTQAVFDRLREQFRRREIKKTYLALVWGQPIERGTIELALAHDRGDRRRMVAVQHRERSADRRVWQAITRYRVIATASGMSLLEVEMETGVTHQIRVHLSSNGYPIVGDTLYGADYPERFGLARHCLHASSLTLRHPASGQLLCVDAQLPVELREVLQRIEMAV